jgi:type IV secretory pathway VirB2 component (pilin)
MLEYNTVLWVLNHAQEKLMPILPLVIILIIVFIATKIVNRISAKKLRAQLANDQPPTMKPPTNATINLAFSGILLTITESLLFISVPCLLFFDQLDRAWPVIIIVAVLYGIFDAIRSKSRLAAINQLAEKKEGKEEFLSSRLQNILILITKGILSMAGVIFLSYMAVKHQSMSYSLIATVIWGLILIFATPIVSGILLLITKYLEQRWLRWQERKRFWRFKSDVRRASKRVRKMIRSLERDPENSEELVRIRNLRVPSVPSEKLSSTDAPSSKVDETRSQTT